MTSSSDDLMEELAAVDLDSDDYNVWGDFRNSIPQRQDQLERMNTINLSFVDSLTATEKREIRAWERRLTRDQVFSRYYCPEQWEVREMNTIEKFLSLDSSAGRGDNKETKQAVSAIFYPSDHAPKSVLLKRGPILLDGTHERELLLFSHGFVVSRIEFNALLNILFTINSENPTYLDSKQLRKRFDAVDSDNGGAIDRCEIKEMFTSLGVPVSEEILGQILDRFDADGDGEISYSEFENVMQELGSSEDLQRKSTLGRLSSLGKKLKASLTHHDHDKVDSAYLFSDITKVESLNVCHSDSTEMIAMSNWGEMSFSIFVKGKNEPLVMICSKPEQKLAWIDALQLCYVKSTKYVPVEGLDLTPGWQHIIIRASIFSLVVCNDIEGLKYHINNPSADIDINDGDEYDGYTALHFAAIFGNYECAEILLTAKAKLNVPDNENKYAFDHAMLSGNEEMVQLLERHGGKASASAVLFESAVQELQQTKSEERTIAETQAKAQDASGAMSEGMSALRERGEKLEKMSHQTVDLQSEAADYASNAKALKQKCKKKSLFGF